MNDAIRMQISAFVDDELPEKEADMLLHRLAQDEALRSEAERYFAIGRLIRGERNCAGSGSLRARISAAVALETSATSDAAAGNRYLRPAAGVAIAASVALLAIVGLRQVNLPEEPRPVSAANAGIAIDDSAGYTEPAARDVMSDRPSEMLMQYYLSHGETSNELGANGILSKLVTLELRGGELVEVPAKDEPLAVDPADVENGADGNLERE